MANDPFEGLNADEWRKSLRGLEGDIDKMRTEAAALDAELKAGRRSAKDIQAETRRGARIGKGPSGGQVSAAAEETAGRRAATNARTIADQEARAAAARAQSLKSMERLAGLRLGTPVTLAGGGGVLQPPGGIPPRQLPAGPQPVERLALPPGRTPLALPPGPIIDTQKEKIEGAKKAISDLERGVSKAGTGTGTFSSNLRRNQAVLSASSREMRKFGALTTEFISAAGRGAVTVRELGFQVSSTIGKFGGWLVAGSAVYTAFGAISAVGRGAIDAQSGVSQLQRVVNNLNADEATKSFRDLSRSFNLPIGDVTEAAFEMGKVFHNQNDALEATKTILSSVKVGELDVATSSRYLTSIITAFNLPASQMTSIFDQINQAQNEFGIRIDDTLAGLSKASGTFKAAGGDISTLLALITTARRATGQTGEVIGTAIARSPNFLRKADNRATLRQFGINPDQDIVAVYEDAFKKVQKLSGRKGQELAAAILGPQYGARIGTPLFQQFDLFQKVLDKTSPEKSKGSAQRELRSELSKTSEQIQKVVVQLEALGSSLAEAGFLTPFFLLLKLLNSTLSAAVTLVDVFNELPKPLRLAVSSFAQIVGFIALMRRFNVGESFGGRGASPLGTLFTRRNQEAFRYRNALTEHKASLSKELESNAQTSVRRSLDVDAARLTAEEERAALARLEQRAATGQLGATEAAAEQKKRVTAAERHLEGAVDAEIAQMTKSKAVARHAILVDSQLAEVNKKTTDARARALADANGVIIPGSVGPSTQRAAALADPALQEALAPDLIRAQNAVIAADSRAHAIPPSTMKTKLKGLTENFRSYGLMGGTLATANQATKSVLAKVNSALTKLRGASIGGAAKGFLKGVRNVGKALLQMVNPLDLILIGGILLLDAFIQGQQQVDDAAKKIKELSKSGSAEGFKSATDELIQSIGERGGFGDTASLFGPVQAADNQLEEINKAESERTNELIALIHGSRPKSTQYLFAEDFKEKGLDELVTVIQDGFQGAKSIAKRATNLVKTVQEAQNLNDEEKAALVAEIRVAVVESRGIKASFDQIAALTTEDLTKRVSDYADAVSSGFSTLKQRQILFQDALVFAADRFGSNKPEDIAGLSKALDDAVGAITTAAQSELERSLFFAKGQKDRNAAYQKYFEATSPKVLRGQASNLIRQQQNRLRQNNEVQSQLRQFLKGTPINKAFDQIEKIPGLGPLPKYGREAIQKLQFGPILKELQDRAKDSKELRGRITGIRKALKEAIKRHNYIVQQVRRQQFEENQEMLKSRSELRVARAPEGIAGIRIQLQTIGTIIERAIKVYGRNSKEVLELLVEQQSLRDQAVEETSDLIQAKSGFRAAHFSGKGQESQKAKVELQGLKQQLAYEKAHPRQFSPSDILQLETQVLETGKQLAEEVEQRAEDMRGAALTVRAARAEAKGNDVGARRAELAKSLYTLRHAKTPLEKREAQAEVIKQRTAYRESIYQREIEDVEYSAEIGKLTLQQQISQYQQLLKTLNLNRDQRRDLKRRIHQLKQETEDTDNFELRVGDIQLPTIYDIRRAVGGGRSQQYAYNDNSNTVVNVQVNGGEPKELYRQMDNALNRHNKNARRSAGLRP